VRGILAVKHNLGAEVFTMNTLPPIVGPSLAMRYVSGNSRPNFRQKDAKKHAVKIVD